MAYNWLSEFQINDTLMIRNYLKVTIRNMVRNKLFTFINIFGMSISLACCIILFIYTNNELNFDKYHGNDIYRITAEIKQKDGELFKLATSSIPIAPTIKEEIPEIIQAARAAGSSVFGGKNVISYEGNNWFIEDGIIADTALFGILKFDIIAGNKNAPLPHHDGVVLEKTWVKTIFGNQDPLGKMVKIGTNFGNKDFEVTAVYDKSVFQSHMEPSFIISMANNQWNSFFNIEETNWVGNNMVFSYLKLAPGSDAEKVSQLIEKVFLKYGAEEMKAMGVTKELNLQPLEAIHTEPDFYVNVKTTNKTFIYVLGSIGVFILILSCVNYINLSTARAGKRSLEVGIRKVMGVTPRGLIMQFLGESFLIVLLSMIISLFIVQLAIPFFNLLIDNPIFMTFQSLSDMAAYLVGFLILTSFIAGFYPAFYLASFKPQEVLKSHGKDGAGNTFLRKSLVVLQFVITICLISSILIISNQVDFIKNKDLGFNAGTKLIIPLSSEESSGKYELLRNQFKTNSEVQNISGSNGIPGMLIPNDLLIYKDGQTMNDAVHIFNNMVDLEFPQVLGLKLLSGNYFQDYRRDSVNEKILISETGMNMLGYSPEEAPGQLVHFDWEGNTFHYEIVGVVSNIHQSSLHKTIDPIMYTVGDGKDYGYMTIEANLTDFQGLIDKLGSQWKEIIKETPFEYYGLNDHLLLQYKSDFNTFSLIKYFAIISIIISCLGLYAMSLFLAEKRYKEIGIRKTFGASVGNIFAMVSSDLSILIVISFIISIPITWYGMNQWLESFAYKITPGLSVYLFAGFISIFIGWFTIAYQSIKAANTNPVDVLKEE